MSPGRKEVPCAAAQASSSDKVMRCVLKASYRIERRSAHARWSRSTPRPAIAFLDRSMIQQIWSASCRAITRSSKEREGKSLTLHPNTFVWTRSGYVVLSDSVVKLLTCLVGNVSQPVPVARTLRVDVQFVVIGKLLHIESMNTRLSCWIHRYSWDIQR